jgi:hypothetical protein
MALPGDDRRRYKFRIAVVPPGRLREVSGAIVPPEKKKVQVRREHRRDHR